MQRTWQLALGATALLAVPALAQAQKPGGLPWAQQRPTVPRSVRSSVKPAGFGVAPVSRPSSAYYRHANLPLAERNQCSHQDPNPM